MSPLIGRDAVRNVNLEQCCLVTLVTLVTLDIVSLWVQVR